MSRKGDLIISGDCGGTNTRLTLWLIPEGAKMQGTVAPGEILFAKQYVNEEHSSFAEVCNLFLTEAKLKEGEVPIAAVLACAGPIRNNTVDFTNIAFGWSINGPTLQKQLGIQVVKLINDFAAMGYGLLTLKPHESIVINDVPAEEGAPIATIGAGTGLGECFLTMGTNGKYSCFACEGGHTDFAPTDALEVEIYNWMKAKVGCQDRLSQERVVSGPGLAQVYEFLSQKFPEKVNAKIQAEFESANTLQGKVIGSNAETDELCGKAMEVFVKAYGREAGNAMLKYLPRGGFYITGGLAPKNLKFFTKKTWFKDSMFNKGRVSGAIKDCPVYLVLTEELGERGAHYYAYQLLQSIKDDHKGVSDVADAISKGKYGEEAKKQLEAAFKAAGVTVEEALKHA